jgi:ribose 5-phosphate isomerase A
VTMVDQIAEKRAAAARSLDYVRAGQLVGLGSGSTAALMVEMLGERVRAGLDVRGVATSAATRQLAEAAGVPLLPLEQVTRLDLTIDGADEVDQELRLIKGGGGALLHEKIVASASDRLIVIVDSSKLVARLGRAPLPVEVVPAAGRLLREKLKAQGCMPTLRLRTRGREPFVTAEGNHILDCDFGEIADPARLARVLADMPGLVEHGLFIEMADLVIVGRDAATEVLTRRTPGDQLA